MHGETVKLAKK